MATSTALDSSFANQARAIDKTLRPLDTSRLYRIWIPIGVVFLSLEAYVLVRWIASPYFKPSPLGSDPVPPGERITVRIWEATCLVLFLVALWIFIISPVIKRQPLTANGRIFIAASTCYWMDPIYNYSVGIWYYNALHFNMGSWVAFIPGWVAPGQETFPEPLLGAGLLWFLCFGTTAKVGGLLFRKYREICGSDALIRPLLMIFTTAMLFDAAYENLVIRLHLMGFVSSWDALTLWAGTPEQYPLFEMPMNAMIITSMALLSYSKDDHGMLWCERGLHKLHVSQRVRTLLGVLAAAGCAQFVVAFLWMTPFQFFAMHTNVTAPMPTYRLGGICGKGTQYACPDGKIGFPTVQTKPEFIVGPMTRG
jgi:hypothetical protein